MSETNKVLTELIHKDFSEQSDTEKALLILWEDGHGFESLAIAGMVENAKLLSERDALKAAVDAAQGVTKSFECYTAQHKPETEWDEYDYMMLPFWKKLLAELAKLEATK